MSQEPVGQRTFSCPGCGHELSARGGSVIKLDGVLRGERFVVRTRFLVPSGLGSYGAEVQGPVTLEEGARVTFRCPNPACDRDLTAAYCDELAEIRMTDATGREFVVVFHKIYGKRATFVVDIADRELVARFGEHADTLAGTFERPLNFFGAV